MAGLRRLWDWLLRLPENRVAVWALVAINLGGAVYGFNWYKEQLLQSPLIMWPVIPDSPLAALYFGLFLLTLQFGWRVRLLAAVAFVSMVKYGLWTVLVFSQYWWAHGVTGFEEVHLTLSHLSMAVEAAIFLRYYYPGLGAGLAAGLWFALDDYVDYFHGAHAHLPDPAFLPSVTLIAYGLTVVALVTYFGLGGRAARAGRSWRYARGLQKA